MSGNVYSCSFSAVAVTAQVDFFELLCPTDAVLEILSVDVDQSTEAGDAQAEMLAYKIVRGHGSVTSGSGGAAGVIKSMNKGAVASGVTAETNNTTKMAVGTGTLHTMDAGAFHVAAGLHYKPLPEERIYVSPGDRITVELATTPADSISFSGTIRWRELGG